MYRIELETYVNENIELSPDVLDLVERLAAEKNRTTNEIINDVLKYHIADKIELQDLASADLAKPYIVLDGEKPIAYITPLKVTEVAK